MRNLVKTEERQKKVRVTMKVARLNVLNAMEQIVELSSGSDLSKDFFAEAKRYINFLCRKLSLSHMQAVLLSLFVDNCDDYRIELKQLASHIGCRTIRIIQYGKEIDDMVSRKLIRCRRDRDSVTYRVPLEVMDAFRRNEAYVPYEPKNITCDELFGVIEELFDQRNHDELSFNDLRDELERLFDNNSNLEFVKQLRRYCLADDCGISMDGVLFVCMANIFVNDDDDDICPHQFEDLFPSKGIARSVKSRLSRGEHTLQEQGLVEFANDDGFADRNAYKLTDKAKGEVLAELDIDLKKAISSKELILHGDIVSKRLFYNERERKQIDQLAALLTEERYAEVCRRLDEAGMRKGFACLFYGEPGTGKTETALQLARMTGRDIMLVNFAEMKSCWVGESEKNVKALFDRYRALVKERIIAPILLFNEADALIGKRQEGAERAVDKMENTIQNIILQEMETLNGILIATTNLTQNMDRAFERRFLYKIRFDKPCPEAKQSIWQTIIPDLAPAGAAALAKAYDFSGGQIENISRKHAVDSILFGYATADLERIKGYCDEELIVKEKAKRKIGF